MFVHLDLHIFEYKSIDTRAAELRISNGGYTYKKKCIFPKHPIQQCTGQEQNNNVLQKQRLQNNVYLHSGGSQVHVYCTVFHFSSSSAYQLLLNVPISSYDRTSALRWMLFKTINSCKKDEIVLYIQTLFNERETTPKQEKEREKNRGGPQAPRPRQRVIKPPPPPGGYPNYYRLS